MLTARTTQTVISTTVIMEGYDVRFENPLGYQELTLTICN